MPRGRSRRSTGPRPRVRGQEAPGRNSRFGIAPRRCRSAFVIPWRLRRNRRAARGAHRPDAPEGNDRQHDPTEPVVNPSRRRRDCRPQFRGQPYRSGAAPKDLAQAATMPKRSSERPGHLRAATGAGHGKARSPPTGRKPCGMWAPNVARNCAHPSIRTGRRSGSRAARPRTLPVGPQRLDRRRSAVEPLEGDTGDEVGGHLQRARVLELEAFVRDLQRLDRGLVVLRV